MKLPRPYLSHSQFWLFNHDPEEYYKQYYIARIDKPTPKMVLGKLFQEAWSDRAFNYIKALKKAGFNSDQARIFKFALEHPTTIRFPKNKTEKRLDGKGLGLKYPIMGYLDGFDKAKRHLVENKLGVVWTQDRADESTQITWYALLIYLNFKFIPKRNTLQSFNGRNGMPNLRETKRIKQDLKFLVEAINEMHDRILADDFRN